MHVASPVIPSNKVTAVSHIDAEIEAKKKKKEGEKKTDRTEINSCKYICHKNLKDMRAEFDFHNLVLLHFLHIAY